MGECSPIGQFFSLGSFPKMTEAAQKICPFFLSTVKLCINFDNKRVGLQLGPFSQQLYCIFLLRLDVFRLREDHRIVGSFIGCLPRTPRQVSDFMSLLFRPSFRRNKFRTKSFSDKKFLDKLLSLNCAQGQYQDLIAPRSLM
jgi:hypothetical protein